MQEQFLNHIKQHNLCSVSDKILLAVSGGLDSMVMLDLFVKAGFNIGVAHFNFQLRGSDSDEDERFVCEQATGLQVPFFTTRFETKAYADKQGISTQMAARELRYEWFEEIMDREGYTRLATAHHLNDSIETMLLNWAKGSLLTSGIPIKNKRIIRPILFATRTELEAYATQHQINWREDSSNSTIDYERNFVRHRIIPLFKELNPALEETVQRGWNISGIKTELFDEAFEHWKHKFVKHEAHQITIVKHAFDNYRHRASLLWQLIHHLGFHYNVCEKIIEALHGQSGKRFVGATHELVIDREVLILSPKVDFWKPITIQNQSHVSIGSWDLSIEKIPASKAKAEILNPVSTSIAFMDADTFTFPLTWRQWHPGDSFVPLGMDQHKKISDFLIDNKVSIPDKSRVTVLESAGQIIWVVGHRISDKVKITNKSQRVLKLEVRPYFA